MNAMLYTGKTRTAPDGEDDEDSGKYTRVCRMYKCKIGLMSYSVLDN